MQRFPQEGVGVLFSFFYPRMTLNFTVVQPEVTRREKEQEIGIKFIQYVPCYKCLIRCGIFWNGTRTQNRGFCQRLNSKWVYFVWLTASDGARWTQSRMFLNIAATIAILSSVLLLQFKYSRKKMIRRPEYFWNNRWLKKIKHLWQCLTVQRCGKKIV